MGKGRRGGYHLIELVITNVVAVGELAPLAARLEDSTGRERDGVSSGRMAVASLDLKALTEHFEDCRAFDRRDSGLSGRPAGSGTRTRQRSGLCGALPTFPSPHASGPQLPLHLSDASPEHT